MAKRSARVARRVQALKARGALHSHPQDVTEPLFRDSAFFDPHDVVQVKYEMLRRVRTETTSVSDAAADFGFSRPAFYHARAAFTREGLPGLLPRKRGPKQAHKLTDEVLAVLAAALTDDGRVPRATETRRTRQTSVRDCRSSPQHRAECAALSHASGKKR